MLLLFGGSQPRTKTTQHVKPGDDDGYGARTHTKERERTVQRESRNRRRRVQQKDIGAWATAVMQGGSGSRSSPRPRPHALNVCIPVDQLHAQHLSHQKSHFHKVERPLASLSNNEEVKRERQQWRWAVLLLVFFSSTAYVAAHAPPVNVRGDNEKKNADTCE